MSSLKMQREAFNQVRKNTVRGHAVIFVQCCRCSVVYRVRLTEVSGFSEWAYKREEPHRVRVGEFTTQIRYTAFEKVGCCPVCTMNSPIVYRGGFVSGLLEALYPKKEVVVEKVAPVRTQLCDVDVSDDLDF